MLSVSERFHESHQEEYSGNRLKSPDTCLHTVGSTSQTLHAAVSYIREK